MSVKIIFIPTLITVWLFSGISAIAQSNSPKIDSVVSEAARSFLKDSSRNALSIGVYDDGKTYMYNYSGADSKSVYEIGSITKTMTGVVLAHAVSDKKVKLDDDIRMYLNGSYPNLEYEGKPIRLFMLLNHSSGLPFDLPVKETAQAYSRKQFLADLHQVKLDTVPGIKLHYSNSAAQLLGFIMERVYGSSYDELLKKFVTGPAKMNHTGLYAGGQHLLRGYNGQGKVMPANSSGAAGGIKSTVPDMLRYIAFSNNERDAVIKLTHEPTWGDIRYYAIGLNWQMQHNDGKPRKIFQGGGTAGFSSCLIFYPDLNRGIILLCNSADHMAQDKLSEKAYEILSALDH